MTSNGHDATMDGLIRRSLAHSRAATPECPDSEILAAYYERSLDSKETTRFETHLSECSRCREQLATLVRSEEKPSTIVGSTWFWDWRILAPAAAALLILTVWGVRRPSLTPAGSHNSNQPLVAMSRPAEVPERQSSADSSPTAPALAPEPKSAAPEPLDRAIPKAKTESETENQQVSRQSQEQTFRNSPGGAGLSPSAKDSANAANAVAQLKKEAPGEAAAPATSSSPAAPAPMSALAAPKTSAALQNQRVASTESTTDDKAKSLEAFRAKPPEPQPNALGGVLAGSLAQLSAQHSGSTIIQTPDPKILWRIAGGNFVERTEDGGASWHGQVADSDAQLTAGSAPTNKVCWLVGKSGMIVVTKDATHWKKLPPPVPADFVSVDAKSNSSAIVTAADGQKFSTENEGKKWVPVK
jgi:hypothetical protein